MHNNLSLSDTSGQNRFKVEQKDWPAITMLVTGGALTAAWTALLFGLAIQFVIWLFS